MLSLLCIWNFRKFNDWMQRYGQKTSKMPQTGASSPICDPKILFQNQALSFLYPCGALTSCKKLEKTNERSLRYLKTDIQTHWQGPLLRIPSGKPWVQNISEKVLYINAQIGLFGASAAWLSWQIFTDRTKISNIFH